MKDEIRKLKDAAEALLKAVPEEYDGRAKLRGELKAAILREETARTGAEQELEYWKARYKRIKQEREKDLRKLGEDIMLEFFREFDELIPSVMEEKIEILIREMVGEGVRNE